MQFLRALLIPFSWIYGFITYVRNLFYDWGVFKITEFPISIIAVGNLSTGGTGKTPTIEYLIELLQNNYSIATLSRGYKRKTSGYVLADANSTAHEIGDEPMQYKRKYHSIQVAVDANRKRGIQNLQAEIKGLQLILLDDAFQHRSVKAGLSILLTDYSKLFFEDEILPSGSLREQTSGARRADIIVVTKTPENLSPIEKRIIIKKINPLDYQQVYFSFIQYAGEVAAIDGINLPKDKAKASVLLVCGIANPAALLAHLKMEYKEVRTKLFPDHYDFKQTDLIEIQKEFDSIPNSQKYIITTEKDWMRLQKQDLQEQVKNLPLLYLPIRMDFNEKEKEEFNTQVLNYVRTN